MTTEIDPRKALNYRKLRFATIDDCSAEVRSIVGAEQKGTLRCVGNWTPGQIMAHVAAWIEYGYVGYPIKSPPFFIRWILRLSLRKMLRDGMQRGIRIPGIKDGTVGMDKEETQHAAERLLNALQRLKNARRQLLTAPHLVQCLTRIVLR